MFLVFSSIENYNIRKDKEDGIAKKAVEEYKNLMMRLQKQFFLAKDYVGKKI